MSAQTSFEIVSESHTAAAAIDHDFRIIADCLPLGIRRDARAGQIFRLANVSADIDLGRDISQPDAISRYIAGLELTAQYLGHTLNQDPDRDTNDCRLIAIKAQAVGEAVADLAFFKEYEVGYGWELHETMITTAEDFADCPVPPSLIAFMTTALRQAIEEPETTALGTLQAAS